MSGAPGRWSGGGAAAGRADRADRAREAIRGGGGTRWLALALAIPLGLSCGRASGPPPDPRQSAPAPDSVTVALWRFDEAAGVRCGDAGPFRLDATAGPGTRVSYGRFSGAREFTRVIDSFVHAPHNPVFDVSGGLTVEAWVFVRAFGTYEDTPIAARWTQEGNQQSWLFGIVGAKYKPLSRPGGGAFPAARRASPGYHDALVASGQTGQMVFAFQPADAGTPYAFASTQRLPLERWTHVAVSYDGRVVRFFVNGRLDAQYATPARIHASSAPLLVGNYFDPRRLTSFSGELRMDPGSDDEPYYAFEGLIDELRISNTARGEFPGAH